MNLDEVCEKVKPGKFIVVKRDSSDRDRGFSIFVDRDYDNKEEAKEVAIAAYQNEYRTRFDFYVF